MEATAACSLEAQHNATSSAKDVDFISKLPDVLLCKILSYASLREAVRTSILSSRWRHVSAYKPLLQFNWEEMFITEEANYDFWILQEMSFKDAPNRMIWESQKEFCDLTKGKPCLIFNKKIVDAINNYIRFYKGEKIDLFEVNFCFLTCPEIASLAKKSLVEFYDVDIDIDEWVKFALNKGVESLILFIGCSFDCCPDFYFDVDSTHFSFPNVFRTELFDNRTINFNLKHLKLGSCLFGPYISQRLSSLETLYLHNVDFRSLKNGILSLFPYVGNLRTLEIYVCELPVKISLASFPLLQRFVALPIPNPLRKCPSLVEEIELANPNLVTLELIFKFNAKHELGDSYIECNFGGAPKLTFLSWIVPVEKIDLFFTNLPRHNPELRDITLEIPGDWANWIPGPRVATHSQVTHLKLRVTDSKFSLVRVMAFLKAFPLLSCFQLFLDCTEDLKEEEKEEEEEQPEFLSYVPECLTQIAIMNCFGTPKQLGFAVHLLKNANALEKMVITVRGRDFPFGSSDVKERIDVVNREVEKFDERNILDVQEEEGSGVFYYGVNTDWYKFV